MAKRLVKENSHLLYNEPKTNQRFMPIELNSVYAHSLEFAKIKMEKIEFCVTLVGSESL